MVVAGFAAAFATACEGVVGGGMDAGLGAGALATGAGLAAAAAAVVVAGFAGAAEALARAGAVGGFAGEAVTAGALAGAGWVAAAADDAGAWDGAGVCAFVGSAGSRAMRAQQRGGKMTRRSGRWKRGGIGGFFKGGYRRLRCAWGWSCAVSCWAEDGN